jgi:threonyl-tRNA synthetase
VRDQLRADGLRVELDGRSESVSRKIRDAELRKTPYMLVVGEREEHEGTVSVRQRHGEEEAEVSTAELSQRLLGQL